MRKIRKSSFRTRGPLTVDRMGRTHTRCWQSHKVKKLPTDSSSELLSPGDRQRLHPLLILTHQRCKAVKVQPLGQWQKPSFLSTVRSWATPSNICLRRKFITGLWQPLPLGPLCWGGGRDGTDKRAATLPYDLNSVIGQVRSRDAWGGKGGLVTKLVCVCACMCGCPSPSCFCF